MKKVLLSMAVVALLAISCKKVKEAGTDLKDATVEAADKAKDGADKVVDAVESALEGVKIPSFSNPAVTENLKSYASYAKEYVAAKGNLGKITAMASKGTALLAKGKELASKLDVKEMAQYKSVLSAIQSKMAPAK